MPRSDLGVSLPTCARELLTRPGLLQPFVTTPRCEGCTNLSSVAHAYLIHYTLNKQRYAYQKEQLPRLGLNVSLVTGFDAGDIDEGVRSCVLRADSRMAASYVSQTLKLHVALHDMLTRGHDPVLVLEDDARILFDRLSPVNAALQQVRQRDFAVLFASTFSPSGFDSLGVGLHKKVSTSVPAHRGLGRTMPLVGAFVSARGTRHVLGSLPIVAEIDRTLSGAVLFPRSSRPPTAVRASRRAPARCTDALIPSAQQHGLWYVKLDQRPKYAFLPSLTQTENIAHVRAREPRHNESSDIPTMCDPSCCCKGPLPKGVVRPSPEDTARFGALASIFGPTPIAKATNRTVAAAKSSFGRA